MELDCLVKNGLMVIPGEGIIEGSIGIKDERIVLIARNLDFITAKEVINAQGNYVLPGVIEPHVHFGLGSQLEEDFLTETR